MLAIGGDLAAQRLLFAYERGIFPWYSEHEQPLWWSPDPRAVLEVEDLHVSRSLQRHLERGAFELSWNKDFPRVIHECSLRRNDGTWIHEEVRTAYIRLHELGHAHSLEVYEGSELVGGIYGVQRGALFAAESKFYRRKNASKVALVACVRSLARAGIELFDVQLSSSYLQGLGVTMIPRKIYLRRLRRALDRELDLKRLELDWRP